MKKKIILSSILALGVLGGVVGVARFAEPVNAASTTYYLNPGVWASDGPDIWGHFWTGSTVEDIKMTDSNGDGILEANVKQTYSNCLFVRQKSGSSSIQWNSKWNQTADLTIPSDKDCYVITDWNTGKWEKYTYVTPTVSFMGTLTDWATGEIMSESNGIYTYTTEVTAGEYSIKIKRNSDWLGCSNINVEGLNDYANDADDNIVFTAENGTYTFEFNLKENTLNVSYIPAANPTEEAIELLTLYYNEGTYTRNTTINLNTEALDDISTHFHGSVVLERTTLFQGGELWMTRGETETTYSYYGTSGENMTTGSATEWGEAPTSVGIVTNTHKDWDNPEEEGMEGFYITLKDIMEKASTVEWTYSNGVYSTTGLTEEFLAFTAPCLLDTQNYVQYTGVEVAEVGETLVLRLLASETNSGALSVETNVLSQAVITK